MSINTRTRCWSCTDKVGSGYRIKLYLAGDGMKKSVCYVSAALCSPCMSTVNRVFGEKGSGALKRAASEAARAGDGGETP